MRALDENGLRQCLRIAGGATIALFIGKAFNWNYASFFCVMPMLLLGIVPTLNAHIVRQFLSLTTVACLETLVIYGLFGDRPGLMLPLAFASFFWRFWLMAQGPLFMFGAMGTVFLSILLHFASYPGTDLFDLCTSMLVGAVLTLLIAFLMFWLFPDVEPRPAPKPVTKDLPSRRHEALLGACVATLSFAVFQVFDLQDSLSAQVASILILFPMQWQGIRFAGRVRALGTLLGCAIGLLMQLVLLDHHNVLPLVTLLYWIGVAYCARYHVREGIMGVGFGSLTTLGIVFGQYLTPTQDVVYAIAYRFSSVSFSVLVTLLVVYALHHLLNRFPSTRHA